METKMILITNWILRKGGWDNIDKDKTFGNLTDELMRYYGNDKLERNEVLHMLVRDYGRYLTELYQNRLDNDDYTPPPEVA